jgi:hypothetical protein
MASAPPNPIDADPPTASPAFGFWQKVAVLAGGQFR